MNELVLFTSSTLPTLIDNAGDTARMRFLEFFTANIRNANTRRAYAKACEEFLAWCSFAGVPSIADVQPIHVGEHDDVWGIFRPQRAADGRALVSGLGTRHCDNLPLIRSILLGGIPRAPTAANELGIALCV
jgi:hypothetical protein